MHSRDGHFVQIDFSLPLFPFSKFDTKHFGNPEGFFGDSKKKAKHGNICQSENPPWNEQLPRENVWLE